MKIAFLDATPVRYGIGALDAGPLGGSQSAMLVVAGELAALGHQVTVVARHLEHGARHGALLSLNLRQAELDGLPEADVAVSVNEPLADALAARFPRRPRVVHWHKNDVLSHDAAALAPGQRPAIDRFVFGTHWQASGFIARLALPAERVSVIENPLAPVFCGMHAPGAPILAGKNPALLIYASAPNRGLEGLATVIFPALRRQRPELRLEVYSGFFLSQGLRLARRSTGKLRDYDELLAKWGATPGVSLQRGVPKAQLAERLRRAVALCYPCNFRETSCHVMLEAMAAGCLVSATQVGALPESGAGFARLTPYREPEGFSVRDFVGNTLKLLDEAARDPGGTEARLQRQVAHVNARHAPAAVGRRWHALLAAAAD